jgi:hypothetical protein
MRHVYFVEGAGLIKIGSASQPIARFNALLTGSPVPLSLLASMPGGPGVESSLQWQFIGQQSHGEWFHRSPELDAVIAEAEVQYGEEFRNLRAAPLRRWRGFHGQ